jgi:hypothetical protein
MRPRTAAVTLLLLAALMPACARKAPPPPPPATPLTPDVKVTAEQLYKDYQDNSVAADQKYKDKVVQVTGKVLKVGKDTFGNEMVSLATGADLELGITCYFGESARPDAAKLSPGQTAVMTGRCVGLRAGSYIQLNDCTIGQPQSGNEKPS